MVCVDPGGKTRKQRCAANHEPSAAWLMDPVPRLPKMHPQVVSDWRPGSCFMSTSESTINRILRYPYFTFVDGGDYRNDYQVLCHQATFAGHPKTYAEAE